MWAAIGNAIKNFAIKESKKLGIGVATGDKSSLNKVLIVLIPTIGLFFVIIVVIITFTFGPILLAKQYIDDVGNNVSLFFEKVGNVLTFKGWCSSSDGSCDKKAEQKYYEQLDLVYSKYKDNGVTIDVQLITATIFYGNTINDDMFNGEDSDIDGDIPEVSSDYSNVKLSDVRTLASKMVSGSRIDYDKYRSYLDDTYVSSRFSDLYSSDVEKEKIIDEIMGFASLDTSNSSYASENCSFNEQEKIDVTVDSDYIDNLMIKTLYPYYHDFNAELAPEKDVEFIVPFKEYVAGVVYREIAAGIDQSITDETIKANIIAIKSYTLGRRKPIESGGKYYISMRNNTDDQVYCNLDKGCQHYATFGDTNLMDAASLTVKEKLYKLYDEVEDEYLFNTANNNFTGAYTASKALCVSIGASTNCLSQTDSISMGNNGSDYKSILMTFYNDNVGFLNINDSTVSMGTYACGKTTYMGGGKYSSNAPRYDNSADFFANINYAYYQPYSVIGRNIGQCVWYARGRAIEILANSNIPEELKQERINNIRNLLANGEGWYNGPSDSLFSKSNDIYAAKPGAIFSWYGGSNMCSPKCGHVAIIEDVEYDSTGKASKVLLSDGWNTGEVLSTASYSYRWMDIETLKIYRIGSYYEGYNGYVYLLD